MQHATGVRWLTRANPRHQLPRGEDQRQLLQCGVGLVVLHKGHDDGGVSGHAGKELEAGLEVLDAAAKVGALTQEDQVLLQQPCAGLEHFLAQRAQVSELLTQGCGIQGCHIDFLAQLRVHG